MNRPAASAILDSPASIAAANPADHWDYFLVAAIFAGMIALAYVALATPLLQPLVDLARRQHWGGFWVRPTVIWIAMGLVLMFMRTVLWLCYRPFAPAAAGEAPALTVIIPAYNEGAMVESSIASVAAASYPRGRLEIIAIDDGSKDDTWRYIERAARRFPGLVTPIRLPENRG
ncbi:MAG TPA: glycosyltransferase, partial [Burkholderiales bacterium]|nr:glycosyltransferase [Burkholderiales bacterium]